MSCLRILIETVCYPAAHPPSLSHCLVPTKRRNAGRSIKWKILNDHLKSTFLLHDWNNRQNNECGQLNNTRLLTSYGHYNISDKSGNVNGNSLLFTLSLFVFQNESPPR